MQKILSGKEMKQIDRNTIDHFRMPGIVLMERAACRVVEYIENRQLNTDRVLVVCGCANNGGDGLAVARLLTVKGVCVDVVLVGDKDKMTPDASRQLEILKAYGVKPESRIAARNYTLMIDALLGIGASRNLEGEYRDTVEQMNNMDGFKLAIDIPSGVDAGTGKILGHAVTCDATVTFAYNKTGNVLYPGAEFAGDVTIADIGINEYSFLGEKNHCFAPEDSDLNLLPERKRRTHKGSFGKVLIFAGCEAMSGAAVLSAKSAMVTGCGMVKVASAENNRFVLNSCLPEALFTVPETENDAQMIKELRWADVVILGPGIGTDHYGKALTKAVLKHVNVPIVIDADALNIIAADRELLKEIHAPAIMTPHLAEMARLIGEKTEYVQDNLIRIAEEFAREYHVVCVLKDARTVTAVPHGEVYLNLRGNNGMATAGSGDVLTGVIAGLLAQGAEPDLAAYMGVYCHSFAGDCAAKENGVRGMLASDMIEGLKKVLK